MRRWCACAMAMRILKGPGFRESTVPSAIDGRHRGRRADNQPRLVRCHQHRASNIGALVHPRLVGMADVARVRNPGAWLLALAGTIERCSNYGWGSRCNRVPTERRNPTTGRIGRSILANGTSLPSLWTCPMQVVRACMFIGSGTLRLPIWLSTKKGDRRSASPMGRPFGTYSRGVSMRSNCEHSVPAARNVFNGKLAAPRIFARYLSQGEMVGLADGQAPAGAVANWDFSREYGSVQLVDTGPNGWHGKTHNRPARLMVGPFWNGRDRPIRTARCYPLSRGRHRGCRMAGERRSYYSS